MTGARLERLMVDWAEEAGALARQHFRRTGDLKFKAGRESVTATDREIEVRLRQRMATHWCCGNRG